MAPQSVTPNYLKHDPDSGLKGGGLRGGPKRWTGKGPRPARHIPWPEIFRHHLSVVEGHEKMIEMIRKHTVEGSGNWKTISEMWDRCHEMVVQTKKATRDFVPPPDLVEQVPIGSSSASMYPGYSPADHIYGEAASEFGKEISKTRPGGWTPRPDGPEYEIGQQRKGKLEVLKGPTFSSASDVNALPLGVRTPTKPTESETITAAIKDEGGEGDGNAFFVIDTNPTPVKHHVPERLNNGSATQPEKGQNGEAKASTIAAEKSSKEDKKGKKGNKRKRDSDAQAPAEEPTPQVNGISAPTELEHEKPKKKKSKNAKVNDDVSQPIPKVANAASEAKKSKKKSKKTKQSDTAAGEVTNEGRVAKTSKKKKKDKKSKKNDN